MSKQTDKAIEQLRIAFGVKPEVVETKTDTVDGQEVQVAVLKPRPAYYSGYLVPWTYKSKKYKRNGNIK